jgi:EmrB/QacA subfamily drug resistance transporter
VSGTLLVEAPQSESVGSELRRRRWFVLTVMSIGAFMTPFDASIVAVSLPSMGADLHLGYSQGLWTQAAYLLVLSVLLIPVGRLADAGGPARYYLAGTVVFGLGSVLAALAQDGALLIGARCVQGLGGASMLSTAAGLVTAAFPPLERGRALGLNVAAVYFGLTLGPVVGGVIVNHTSWRWIFLINVPVALVTAVGGLVVLGIERRERAVRAKPAGIRGGPEGRLVKRVDLAGAVVLGGALVALFMPLTFSPLWGWSSGRTIGLLVAAVALFVLFVVIEDRVRDPMLDLDLLRKNRLFASANAAAFINYLGMFAIATLTAVFLEIVQGHSPQVSGLLLLAQPVVMAVLSPFTGRLSDRVGSRLPAAFGMVIISAGMVQLAFASISAGRVVGALATVGVGMALFSAPNMSAVMGSVHRSQLNLASAFLGMMRFTGQGLSMAILGSIAAWRLGTEGAKLIFLGEQGGSSSVAAYADGYRPAMLVGAALTLVGAAVIWAVKAEPATDHLSNQEDHLSNRDTDDE